MADLPNLDVGWLFGQSHYILMDTCKARLGYELTRLAESPETREALRVSPRGRLEIGIDSNLPRPFHIPRDVGDYHKWPLFGLDVYGRSVERRLIDRVVYMLSEEAIQTLEKYEGQKRPFAILFPLPSVILNILYEDAAKDVTGQRTKDKIQALLTNDTWRVYARQFSAQLLQATHARLRVSTEAIMEELDHIKGGKRIFGTSQPVLDDLESLIQLYAQEMRAELPSGELKIKGEGLRLLKFNLK
ncbi:hypothetical protein HYT92_01055 [Candidatus Pacearchaeota archaeon]|nr:hypothetical protein [Candidatus Pacearchaeota archaeon]